MRDLNHLYCKTPALHARDCEPEGFEWLLADDAETSVFAWLRRAPGERPVAVITNFTPIERRDYRVPLPATGRWSEILNSDAASYGGSGAGNLGRVEAVETPGGPVAHVTLPPLSTLWLQHDGRPA